MSILSQINEIITKRGSCYVVLIDPDKKNKDLIQSQVEAANSADVDFLFIGGSLMMDSNFSERVKQIKYFSKILRGYGDSYGSLIRVPNGQNNQSQCLH